MTSYDIKIRRAVPSDAAGIREVQTLTWRATYPNVEYGITYADIVAATNWWDQPDAIQEFTDRIANEKHDSTTIRLVATIGYKVVGHCEARKQDGKHKLRALYVLPEYQGQGAGYALTAEALKWLGRDDDIVLNVVTYNTNAVSFYKRLGFKITSQLPESETRLSNGKLRPEYEMVLSAEKTQPKSFGY
ncbi:GNAT family N-acetyltransferase [Candidatus Saccharibacteria bacterium]|nr:GNAT family N-acetyltransferase [Candidatus Saccharibacteria bacterium]